MRWHPTVPWVVTMMQSREGEGKDASGLRSVGGGRLREGDGQMKELLPLFFFF